MSLEDVTCLVPLYRSVPQLPRVFENIDDHLRMGGNIICSDEHGLDDAAARIADRYAGRAVTVIHSTDGGNWVSNCNRLIEACETPFLRIMPHDDTFPAVGTALLAQNLRADPARILSHGRVLAERDDGTRLPERDEPTLTPEPVTDPTRFSAEFFWRGHFNGAFKAVMRRDVVNGRPLLIRPTAMIHHSERAWLFGLSLLGSFGFEPDATIRKRYWTGSLTDGWTFDPQDQIHVADTMASYVDDFVADDHLRAAMRFNLYYNAVRRAESAAGYYALRRGYDPAGLPDPQGSA